MRLPDLLVSTLLSFFSSFVVSYLYVVLDKPSLDRTSNLLPEYDFIVVGAGSAGAVVATRLSEDPSATVLLVEDGGDDPAEVAVPWFHIFLSGSDLDWQHVTEPQRDALLAYEDQRSRWPQGRVVGGTSAINSMLYIRGNKCDFDSWEQAGNPGWSYEELLPLFKKAEMQTNTSLAADSEHHGHDGPLTVSDRSYYSPITYIFMEISKKLGYQIGDPNADIQTGFSRYQVTIKDGQRCSTGRCYLHPVSSRLNLHVSLKSRVLKVLVKNDTAIGVLMIKGGKEIEISARKEVILSGGTLGSAKILLLSGIGPEDHLHDIGIPIVKNLPVGLNLQDHVAAYGLSWLANSELVYNPFMQSTANSILEYAKGKTGVLAAPHGLEATGFLNSGKHNDSCFSRHPWPDIQLSFLSLTLAVDGGAVYRRFLGFNAAIWDSYFSPIQFKNGFSIIPILLRPNSRGYVQLRSFDPFDTLIIQPNYLEERSDVETLIEGIKLALQMGNDDLLKKGGAMFHDLPLATCSQYEVFSDSYWECYIRHMAQTDHHPAGTCKMGPSTDATAVVDNALRVHGIRSLRVADASIMPNLVSGNPNAAVIMIGEKASQLIKNYWSMK